MKRWKFVNIIILASLIFLTGCVGTTDNAGKENTKSSTNSSESVNNEKDTALKKEQTQKQTDTEIADSVNESENSEWKLVWSDEFDKPKIDTSIWSYEMGYIRNNELQFYTNRPENARIENGNLLIEARKEDYSGFKYTSASLNTKRTKSWKYAKIEMRAKLPQGKGIWPAFWTMGDNFNWPACGEIDIMEMIGGGKGYDDKIYGTIHWDDKGHKQSGTDTQLDNGFFSEDYHIFGIEWDSKEIRWYLDGTQYFKADITPESMLEFHQNHWILLNLAVGGNWPGSPDDTTIFPQKYYIDWVRVYQKNT